MFESFSDWENELKSIPPLVNKISIFKKHLSEDPNNLATALYIRSEINRKISILYTYAHAHKLQDTRDSVAQAMEDRLLSLSAQVSANLSWIRPEILSIDSCRLKELLADENLREWNRYISEITRYKNHSLSLQEESLMSLLLSTLRGYQKTYSLLANADITYPSVFVPHSSTVSPLQSCTELNISLDHTSSPPFSLNTTTEPVSDALLRRFLQHPQRCVREQAFHSIFSTLSHFKNTFVSLLAGHVNGETVAARIRHFNSSLEASLCDVCVIVFHSPSSLVILQSPNPSILLTGKHSQKSLSIIDRFYSSTTTRFLSISCDHAAQTEPLIFRHVRFVHSSVLSYSLTLSLSAPLHIMCRFACPINTGCEN